jgi:nucleoside-diphosphate-sugar epimerase
MLKDKKILITGGTGNVALSIVLNLASENEVWCAARFSEPAAAAPATGPSGSDRKQYDGSQARAWLEKQGVKTARWSLGDPDMSGLPDDFTHVINAAVNFDPRHDVAVHTNAVGAAMLMAHCRKAEGFIHVSTSAVYDHLGPDHWHKETDPLGGTYIPLPSYPVSKLAAEAAVQAASQVLGVPTTIARMNTAYGTSRKGGIAVEQFGMMLRGEPVAVPIGHDDWCSPIDERDIAEQASGPLFEIASVPTTIVNWNGDDGVSQRQYCQHFADLAGITPKFEEREITWESRIGDPTKRARLIGKCKHGWQEGMKRAIEHYYPGVFDRAK